MNLDKLVNVPQKLDERIIKEKGLEGEDLLPKKILALQVELGELANEWRGFKFWSQDQEPRNGGKCNCDDGYVDVYMGHGVVEQKLCERCEGTYEVPNTLLGEYADCLHFFLSIGTHSNIKTDTEFIKTGNRDVMILFAKINRYVAEMWWEYHDKTDEVWIKWLFGFRDFLRLGEVLGFTPEQIEQAYLEKNQVNHERQESGY